jgi:hypothetical protein
MPDAFGAFLAEALEGVKRDAPACAASMARSIGAARVVVRVDGGTTTIRSDGADVGIDHDLAVDHDADHDVDVTTTSRTLLDLLDGRRSLLSAVTSNAVRVRAHPAEAAGLFDAIGRFVEGVARCADASARVERFRRHVLEANSARGGDR